MSRPRGARNRAKLTDAVASAIDHGADGSLADKLADVYENATLPDDVRLHALGLLACELGLRILRPNLRQPQTVEAHP